MKPKAAKLARTLLLFSCGAILLVLFAGRFTVPVPSTQRVGEFGPNDSSFNLRSEFHAPYHFVIGIPGTMDTPPAFHGVIEVRAPDGSIQSKPITSDSVTPCNWLRAPSVSGFVLGGATPQQFSILLHQGITYHVRLSFTELPPVGCTLWFASMKHVSIVDSLTNSMNRVFARGRSTATSIGE